MAQESPDAAALRAALTVATAEGEQLQRALDAANAHIAELRRDAQAGSKAKADFMARMTHEMRTPLSAIIGLANLALTSDITPATADYLTKIRASAKTLLDIVDDITDFSRLEKGLAGIVPVPFEPAALLARMEGRFSEAAHQKGLAFKSRLDPDIPERLVGDQTRLEQILNHLIGNAVKFTEHGQVTLTIERIGHQPDAVRLEFAVHDTGIGMEPEAIPDMLESFTQADGSLSRPYGGTGLGLAIVQRGLALLGGTMRAESAPGRGTHIAFQLDFSLPAPASQTAQTEPPLPGLLRTDTGQPPLDGAHILLVEDNRINQQVARETLMRFGATVDVASHGGEALKRLKARPYDVVLMDVQMPVMDGLTATRRIRAIPGLGGLPIVALTAHSLAEDRDRCLAAGMNDYLTKPIEEDRLLATLGQWIAPAALRATLLPVPIPTGSPAPPSDAAGLDLSTALARLGGNDRLLYDVLAEFFRDYADSVILLRRDLDAGDLESARRLVHTVKGVAGNIAATELASAASHLEQTIAAGNQPDTASLDAFAIALESTLDAASRLLPGTGADAPLPQAETWRFLLVDDARLNRAIFSRILESAGHSVVPAVNGKEACRLLFGNAQAGAPFDCILMDIEMPEMDGIRAARLIRSLLTTSVTPPCPPDIPIVALTFHEASLECKRCRQAGMTGCLSKVFDRTKLLEAIGRIMRGSNASSCCAPPPATASAAMVKAVPPLLRGLAGHLNAGSIRADEDLAALRQVLTDQPEPPELTALAEAIERYDFATARQSLERLATVLGLKLEDSLWEMQEA